MQSRRGAGSAFFFARENNMPDVPTFIILVVGSPDHTSPAMESALCSEIQALLGSIKVSSELHGAPSTEHEETLEKLRGAHVVLHTGRANNATTWAGVAQYHERSCAVAWLHAAKECEALADAATDPAQRAVHLENAERATKYAMLVGNPEQTRQKLYPEAP